MSPCFYSPTPSPPALICRHQQLLSHVNCTDVSIANQPLATSHSHTICCTYLYTPHNTPHPHAGVIWRINISYLFAFFRFCKQSPHTSQKLFNAMIFVCWHVADIKLHAARTQRLMQVCVYVNAAGSMTASGKCRRNVWN